MNAHCYACSRYFTTELMSLIGYCKEILSSRLAICQGKLLNELLKFAFQNRLGLYWEEHLRLKVDWANCIVGGKFMSVICTKVLLTLAMRT